VAIANHSAVSDRNDCSHDAVHTDWRGDNGCVNPAERSGWRGSPARADRGKLRTLIAADLHSSKSAKFSANQRSRWFEAGEETNCGIAVTG
jgi:hypothetical protein